MPGQQAALLLIGIAVGVLTAQAARAASVSPLGQCVSAITGLMRRAPKPWPRASGAAKAGTAAGPGLSGQPHPRGYVAYRGPAGGLPLNGRLDHPDWQAAPWTQPFQDIRGPGHSRQPWFQTRAKMLWDDACLYIGAQLEDPRPFATQQLHDSVIFKDNDFEVFIDPDGDNHMYNEIEVNAANALWDLLLVRPYRNGGPPLHSWESIAPSEATVQDGPTGWAPLRRAVHVDGTLNRGDLPSRGWSVELAIPWSLLAHAAGRRSPPTEGDQWRINFSRVNWNVTWDAGRRAYSKDPPDQAEENWVWAAQYAVDMHRPETWGYVQFSSLPVDRAASAPVAFRPDPTWPLRAFLMDVYAAQHEHWAQHGRFASSLAALGMAAPAQAAAAGVLATDLTFLAWAESQGGSVPQHVQVTEQGRLTQRPAGSPYDPASGNSQLDT